MFRLGNFWRAVQSQLLGIAPKIGDGYEQIKRLSNRNQPLAGGPGLHRVECIEQHSGKTKPAKGWFKPASAHQSRYFGADFITRFGRDSACYRAIAPSKRKPYQRRRPEFGKTRQWPRVGIEQFVDVGFFQPHVGERIERLAGG